MEEIIPNNILKVSHISASYQEGKQRKTVLHDISFELHENEILGLVGESGCGKSTLSKVILGFIHGAKSSMETCCESFKERGEGTMSNSTGCGCTKIGVDCKAQNCTFNDNCKCEAGDIHIAGDSACSCQETECSSFRCGCGK